MSKSTDNNEQNNNLESLKVNTSEGILRLEDPDGHQFFAIGAIENSTLLVWFCPESLKNFLVNSLGMSLMIFSKRPEVIFRRPDGTLDINKKAFRHLTRE